jgi:Retron-type reverse transcriptase
MRAAQTVLTVIRERGKQHKPIERVYKLLFNRDFYLNAYAKLYPNNGAMTKGVTDETVDGMSIQKIDRMIDLLRNEKYQWKPARREYIPKKNGKMRPLGIPTWGDKLLQEVTREILEAYYEPQFSEHSHGFRPNRGCHTALQEIQIWKGTRWFIEGDISKYFDTIDHSVLLAILEKNIHDGRFIRLISNMLKAGYLDDWKFNQTISGTPQGGVISPLLANIYLNEFDQWIENTLIPQYTKGSRQKSNPAYNRINAEISKARKEGDLQTIHRLEVERRDIPSVDPYDENYRRCRYVRYADDFLIGFTGSKADAEQIKAAMYDFLKNELHLELSQEKTLITNASTQAAKFLGYEIKAQRVNDYIDPKGRRGINGAIALLVPAKVIEDKCRSFMQNGKVTHRKALLNDDDFSIVQRFQQEYRGLVQYYILAQNLSWFSKLYWIMETALLKTLAYKHRSSINKQKARYAATTTSTSGKIVPCLQVVVERPNKKPLVATWGGISLVHKRKADIEDTPYKVYGGRNELIKRLTAEKCELCGCKKNVEVHHIRKLADLKTRGKSEPPAWKQIMAARKRKTLVVCRECHTAIHNGTIKPRS